VLGYLSVRPQEEALAGGFLVGLRRVIMLSGVPPVVAATAIALSEMKTSTLLYWIMATLTVLQVGLLVVVLLAYSAGIRWRRKYKSHPHASLAPG
jgi:hypothetical protein